MIAIIDYGAGNLTSVDRAVTHLGYDGQITTDPETILAAEKVVFPGVGAAKATMDQWTSFGHPVHSRFLPQQNALPKATDMTRLSALAQ